MVFTTVQLQLSIHWSVLTNSYILVTSQVVPPAVSPTAHPPAVLLTAHPPAVLLTAHPPDTNTEVFDPKPGTDRLEQIYLLHHCNLKTNFKKPLIVATLN